MDGAIQSENLNDYGNWIVVALGREATPQDEANLRLIAAAPELLAFAIRVSEYTSDPLFREAALDLIAKAEAQS